MHVSALAWQPQRDVLLTGPVGKDHVHALGSRPSTSAAQILQDSAHQPTIYEIALQELRQLESEPLCHRVAARLLVSNCKLLEGKDEATVLTDSGRQIRDFVDSYAASLAICDLERGSFVIPRECAKFRELALSQLSTGDTGHLHVTSSEIDDCLSGLGSSDSAWNTWVSYRHKALRFCDAARADNDKAQHIMLFQRLAEIMKKMTDSVEQELEIRMEQFDKRAGEWADRIGDLSPAVDRLGERLRGIEAVLSGDLAGAFEKSTDAVNGGIKNAISLQRMLETMMRDVMNSHAEAASAHEHSLQVMSRRAESEMDTAMAMVAAALTSSTALQDQIVSNAHHEILHLPRPNEAHRNFHDFAPLSWNGLQRLVDVTEGLSTKYDDHTELLHRAQNVTSEILDTLEDTAASVSFIGDSFSKHDSASSWWPYIWCPAATLVMGSYGLPPSALRNLGLLALGQYTFLEEQDCVGRLAIINGFTLGTEYNTSPTFTGTYNSIVNLPYYQSPRREDLGRYEELEDALQDLAPLAVLRDEPVGQVRSPQVARQQEAVDLEDHDQDARLEVAPPP
ncbi:hypothetical protein DL769_003740 [Monosporascus sp. CRB-8-3]|nr:hypothetical protein DL769_003740 [Monosporascus sp. CRB-8-3]